MRIALGIEYDGAAFQGWQSQPHGQTVQDHLEHALSMVAATPITVVCAGRTDTGVHGLGQVAHFDTLVERPRNAWVRGVNAHLPGSVAVRWAAEVDERFHARFSATSRHYRYVLFNSPTRPAIFRGKVGWHHAPLDEAAMREAAGHLVGEHDFSSFRSSECQAKTPIKRLIEVRVARVGQCVVFDVHGTAFLHHMVRNMVGALVEVGRGVRAPEWLKTLLEARDRTQGPPTFAPDGLYLTGVEYDLPQGAGWQLPQNGRIIAPLPSFSA
ncbi:MAG: hypothetical protein RIR70_1122 [Pseudomonadota bacterium]